MDKIVIIKMVGGFIILQDNKMISMPNLREVHSFLDRFFGTPLITPEELLKRKPSSQHQLEDLG